MAGSYEGPEDVIQGTERRVGATVNAEYYSDRFSKSGRRSLVVKHNLGKIESAGSIPADGSIFPGAESPKPSVNLTTATNRL